MSDERLSSLGILSIKKEHVENKNFEEVINKFAETKMKRQKL